jgi:hypothetical protein
VKTARRRSEQRLITGLEQSLTTVARPWPTTVLWRWRYELALAGVLVGLGLVRPWLGALAAAGLAACAAVPAVRSFGWCVVTAHRVRTGCAEARIHSRHGRLPAVVRTRTVPDGQRVLLWCPAGVAVDDFRAARTQLAAACWAADVSAHADPRHAHLVELAVVRRPVAPALVARARRHAAAPSDPTG